MTKEEKELLLSDICARLPYRPKFDFHVEASNEHFLFTLKCIELSDDGDMAVAITDRGKFTIPKGHVKPYLFPMSSMTEKHKKELLKEVIGEDCVNLFTVTEDGIVSNDKKEQNLSSFCFNNINFTLETTQAYIIWLYRRHYDVNDLISKGLAIDATGLKIY